MLRDFQQQVEDEIFHAWQEPNVINVAPVVPTGGGKTVIVADIVRKLGIPTCASAHRQELVAQISLALNRERIQHSIIAPKKTQQEVIRLHHMVHGHSAYRYNANTRVASVHTLINADKDRWFHNVGLFIHDEGHHVLRDNIWGKSLANFPNARGLFPTAHAVRGDGLGLGRHADGLVDRLVIGPSARELVNRGFLVDYDIYCPKSDVDFSNVPISSETGDYVQPKLRAATHASKRLVGDIVKHYIKLAGGKRGITFAVDIEEATKLVDAYQKAGVPAQAITSKTPLLVRAQFMQMFRDGKLLQLVSVDCLGEGVDVPAVEVISMGRKTASFQWYAQMCGRPLRIAVSDAENAAWGTYSDEERLSRIMASQKTHAIFIDHVGNCVFHAEGRGRVCSKQQYSLDRREKTWQRNSDAIPLRSCPECTKPYERTNSSCPYCGYEPEIIGRARPEQVDGELGRVDPEILNSLRIEATRLVAAPTFPRGAEAPVRAAITSRHNERLRAQILLRNKMALWGGWRLLLGENLAMAQRRFFFLFGMDVLTAQTLSEREATELTLKIDHQLRQHNVTEKAA